MHFAAFPRGGRAALFIAFPLRCLNTLLLPVSISITTQCTPLKRLFFFSVPVFSNLTKQLSGHFEALPAGRNGPVPLEEKGAELQLQDCVDAAIEE